MLGYGMAKAATHHLVKSLAGENGLLQEHTCSVNAILPGVLNTATNREGMPDADFSEWTPLSDVSNELVAWASDSARRPASGALVQAKTADGVTQFAEV